MKQRYDSLGRRINPASHEHKIHHGHTKTGWKSPTYSTWQSMLARCKYPTNSGFRYYGNRGTTVCKRWLKFANFLSDMGERPKGMTIDRKDNNKGYSPENCRWATPEQQANNMRSNRFVLLKGKKVSIAQLARKLNFSQAGITYRIDAGWPVERIISQPSQRPSVRKMAIKEGRGMSAKTPVVDKIAFRFSGDTPI